MTDSAPTPEQNVAEQPWHASLTPPSATASLNPVRQLLWGAGPVRLLLWGAGPAHLRFLKSLQKQPIPNAEITLLTQHTQVLQPRKFAAYVANDCKLEQCLTDVAPLLSGTGVKWTGRQGRAMDAASRTVLLDDRQVLDYDVLSINIGAQPYREAVEQAMPGAREHALFVPPLEGFINLWPKVCDLSRSRALRIAVVGHCSAGFELALAVRRRMPTAAVTWVPAPQEPPRDYSDGMLQRMLAVLRVQRVTVLYDPVAAFARNDVVLASGARLACDVPLLVLAQATPAWLQETGLTNSEQGPHVLGQRILTDAHQRSTSHPEVFFVQQDSEALAGNLRAVVQSEPSNLRPPRPAPAQFLYAGASHALVNWRGHIAQGRWVAWLKKLARA